MSLPGIPSPQLPQIPLQLQLSSQIQAIPPTLIGPILQSTSELIPPTPHKSKKGMYLLIGFITFFGIASIVLIILGTSYLKKKKELKETKDKYNKMISATTQAKPTSRANLTTTSSGQSMPRSITSRVVDNISLKDSLSGSGYSSSSKSSTYYNTSTTELTGSSVTSQTLNIKKRF